MGGIEARLAVNARLIDGFARDFDDGFQLDPIGSNIVKLTVTNNAAASVEDALSLTSNHGLSRTNPLERHYRDVLCGRVSLHVITGGNATELRQDGNTLDDKDERYARTSEFLDVVRLEWTSEKPFDYNGKYYKVEKGFSLIKPQQAGGIYTFVGGGSDAAIEVAGKHADTFALWGESYAQVRDVTARVRAAAAKHGRPCPRFSLSVRPILADTEEAAWHNAENILQRATALQDQTGYRKPADGHATAGAKRLLALADQGTRIDKRLWTDIAKLTGANSNTTALVGTPEQVAEVFGDYYDLGISHFLIRGFDPLIDAIDYGRELIPLTRRLIAERDAARGRAAE